MLISFWFVSQEPTWDTSSAFFARAAGRNPMSTPAASTTTVKNNAPPTTGQSSQNVKNSSSQPAPAEQIDPVVLRSRQVAGNQCNSGSTNLCGRIKCYLRAFNSLVQNDIVIN